MITDDFVECILDEYEAAGLCGLGYAERAAAKEYIESDIPADNLLGAVNRKLAALILHKSLQRLTEEKDEDWGPARQFKDIYDCRVCANAVAQVSVKGILPPIAIDEFGMTEILTEKELKTAAERLFCLQKRVTKLLGFQPTGN